MKKQYLKRVMVGALAAVMMASVVVPSVKSFANDGTGVYSQEGLSVDEFEVKALVITDKADIYENPDDTSRVLNTIEKGQEITLTGEVCKDGKETGWYEVLTEDKEFGGETAGYIHKDDIEQLETADQTASSTQVAK